MAKLLSLTGQVLFEAEGKNFAETLAEAASQRIKLPGLDVRGRNLAGVDISGLYAPNSNWEGANLYHTVMDYAVLANSNFDGANASHLSAKEADFSGSSAHHANFAMADLTASLLKRGIDQNGEYTGEPFRGTSINLSGSTLDRVEAQYIEIPKGNLNDVSAIAADVSYGNLRRVQFVESEAMKLMALSVDAIGIKLDGTDLTDASIGGDFREATFAGAICKNLTVYTGTKFVGGEMHEAVDVPMYLQSYPHLFNDSSTPKPVHGIQIKNALT